MKGEAGIDSVDEVLGPILGGKKPFMLYDTILLPKLQKWFF